MILNSGLEPCIQMWSPNLYVRGSPLLKTDPPLWVTCGLWRAAPTVGGTWLLLGRCRRVQKVVKYATAAQSQSVK